jgi:TPR repeat protein
MKHLSLTILIISALISGGLALFNIYSPHSSPANKASIPQATLPPTETNASAPVEQLPSEANPIADSPEAAALRIKAKSGDVSAATQLGFLYAYGEEVPKNASEAGHWLQFAADHGDLCAKGGLMFFGLNGGVSQDTGFQLFMQAAENGDAFAQRIVGDSYSYGSGVKQDYTQALVWYQKAADQGSPEAQYDVGTAYSDGLGTEKNDTEAVEWLQKAADQGLAKAQNNLGGAYYLGSGVPKDDAEAVTWW